jgi:hypothetical protein
LLPAGTDAQSEATVAAMLGKPTIGCHHCRHGVFVEGVDAIVPALNRVRGHDRNNERE